MKWLTTRFQILVMTLKDVHCSNSEIRHPHASVVSGILLCLLLLSCRVLIDCLEENYGVEEPIGTNDQSVWLYIIIAYYGWPDWDLEDVLDWFVESLLTERKMLIISQYPRRDDGSPAVASTGPFVLCAGSWDNPSEEMSPVTVSSSLPWWEGSVIS